MPSPRLHVEPGERDHDRCGDGRNHGEREERRDAIRRGGPASAARLAQRMARPATSTTNQPVPAARARRGRAGRARRPRGRDRRRATAGRGARPGPGPRSTAPSLDRDHEHRREVDEDAGAAEQREDDEPEPEDGRVELEVAAEAAGDSCDQRVAGAALEALDLGRVCDVFFMPQVAVATSCVYSGSPWSDPRMYPRPGRAEPLSRTRVPLHRCRRPAPGRSLAR